MARGRPARRRRPACSIVSGGPASTRTRRPATTTQAALLGGLVLGADEDLSRGGARRLPRVRPRASPGGVGLERRAARGARAGCWRGSPGLGRAPAVGATILVIAGYVGVVGASPSVVRAGVAGALAAAAWLLSRPVDRWHLFAAGLAALLLHNPCDALDAGLPADLRGGGGDPTGWCRRLTAWLEGTPLRRPWSPCRSSSAAPARWRRRRSRGGTSTRPRRRRRCRRTCWPRPRSRRSSGSACWRPRSTRCCRSPPTGARRSPAIPACTCTRSRGSGAWIDAQAGADALPLVLATGAAALGWSAVRARCSEGRAQPGLAERVRRTPAAAAAPPPPSGRGTPARGRRAAPGRPTGRASRAPRPAPRRARASSIAATASSSAIGARATARRSGSSSGSSSPIGGHVDGAGGRLEALLQRLGDERGAHDVAARGVVGVADALALPRAAARASARPCGGGPAAPPGSGRGRGRRRGWRSTTACRHASELGVAVGDGRRVPVRVVVPAVVGWRVALGVQLDREPLGQLPQDAGDDRRGLRVAGRRRRRAPRTSSSTRSPRSRRSSGRRSARKVSSGSMAHGRYPRSDGRGEATPAAVPDRRDDRPKVLRAIRRLVARMEGEGGEVERYEVGGEAELGPAEAVGACNALGLFASRRLMLVEGVRRLARRRHRPTSSPTPPTPRRTPSWRSWPAPGCARTAGCARPSRPTAHLFFDVPTGRQADRARHRARTATRRPAGARRRAAARRPRRRPAGAARRRAATSWRPGPTGRRSTSGWSTRWSSTSTRATGRRGTCSTTGPRDRGRSSASSSGSTTSAARRPAWCPLLGGHVALLRRRPPGARAARVVGRRRGRDRPHAVPRAEGAGRHAAPGPRDTARAVGAPGRGRPRHQGRLRASTAEHVLERTLAAIL